MLESKNGKYCCILNGNGQLILWEIINDNKKKLWDNES